jgi:TolA-binding protein
MKPSAARMLGAWCVVLFGAAGLNPAPVGAAPQKPQTIKDLEGQQVDISSQPPQGVDTNKAMDSYRRFLDLNAGDAALRSEALRRLGDLNLESSESERIERELVTNEGLRATEAIHLYSALLKTYPKYERNDAVLYQLARAYELNAQPDKALASLDQLVASYPNSRYMDEAQFRRGELLFSAKLYPAAQAAYEAVVKIGPASAYYNQSLYKHGWSLFKQSENERVGHLEPPESRIGGGHVSRHVDYVLLSRRPEDHRRFRETSQTSALFVSSVCALGRFVHRERAVYGRRRCVSRLRVTGS